MAHFGYTRAAGVWAPLTVLRVSEIGDLDAKTYKAINGDEGGTWAPSSPIWIGGQGLYMNAPLKAFSSCDLQPTSFSVAIPGGSTIVLDATKFSAGAPSGAAILADTTKFTAVSPNGSNGIVVNNTAASPLGAWAWASGTSASFASGSSFTVASGASATVNGTLAGSPTVTAVLALSGSGRVRRRRIGATTDADVTIGIADGDVYDASLVNYTAARSVTLSTSGAGDGDVIDVTVGTNGTTALHNVTVYPSGTVLASNGTRSVRHIFNGSNWVPF